MMRIQLGQHVASAASYHGMKNFGFCRLFCRLKYIKLLLLITLIVFILLIASHLNHGTEGQSFIIRSGYQNVQNDDFILVERAGFERVAASSRSNNEDSGKMTKTAASMEANQNSDLKRRDSKSEFNKRLTLQNKTHCLSWCHRKTGSDGLYFLSAVLLVRIYSRDLAQLSTRELVQWLYYLSYAGFEHVYVYDAFVFKNESQKDALDFLIKQGFVTYVDWSHNAYPYTVTKTQENAYQDCLNKWGKLSTWQASIDIDEYPFCPQDIKPNFMQRFIANYSKQRPAVSQITMQNFLFLGKPLNDNQHPLLIDRLKRRTHGPANALVKPIYKTAHVTTTHVHHHDLRQGESEDADQNRIRLNHYWGARLQNWGEDTPEIMAKTREDNTMK